DARMRILQYFSRLRARDGGTPRAVLDLSHVLARRGHEVVLLTAGGDAVPADRLQPESGLPTVVLLPSAFGAWARVSGRLDRTDAEKVREWIAWADAVHLHVPWDQVGVRIGRTARACGRRYLLTAHGMLDDETMGDRSLKNLKKRLFLMVSARRFLEEAEAVQCTSSVEAEQSIRWFPRGRTVVLPLLCDLSPYERQPEERGHRAFEGADPKVLFLGRLHPIKGLERLIDAAPILRQRHPRVRVVLAGTGEPGYERSLRERIAATGAADLVVPIGHVAGADKLALLRAADAVVLPSRHENFGLSLIEALASGTPVVATRGVNIWRELEASGGAVIAPGTAEGIAEAIARVVSAPASREEMGKHGRAWAFAELDAARVAARYESLYEELRSPRPADA
ncbi:MAG: glycosyltransferase, partial [Phycisphaerales bacterium]|nr:glycosyltransferase [Phycisphaerales bacterium]